MSQVYQHILVSIFQLAEKGELSKIEQQHIIEALVSYGNSIKPEDLNESFKNIRMGSRTLLEQTENCIDTALDMVKNFNKTFDEVKLSIRNMPEGAIYGDDQETLDFIKSLTKDAYNFSQAEKLIGITRQTIKIHADSGKHGLKTFTIGKSKYISREAFINYFRKYFNKDGFPF